MAKKRMEKKKWKETRRTSLPIKLLTQMLSFLFGTLRCYNYFIYYQYILFSLLIGFTMNRFISSTSRYHTSQVSFSRCHSKCKKAVSSVSDLPTVGPHSISQNLKSYDKSSFVILKQSFVIIFIILERACIFVTISEDE